MLGVTSALEPEGGSRRCRSRCGCRSHLSIRGISDRQCPWRLRVPCGADLSYCGCQRRGEASYAPSGAIVQLANVNRDAASTMRCEFQSRKQRAAAAAHTAPAKGFTLPWPSGSAERIIHCARRCWEYSGIWQLVFGNGRGHSRSKRGLLWPCHTFECWQYTAKSFGFWSSFYRYERCPYSWEFGLSRQQSDTFRRHLSFSWLVSV